MGRSRKGDKGAHDDPEIGRGMGIKGEKFPKRGKKSRGFSRSLTRDVKEGKV